MSEFIKSVKGIGIYGQFDFFCQFQEGVNIVYGMNGAGKTTLLHIIANVINRDFLRFVTLDFKKIEIEFSESEPITVELEKIKRHNHYHSYIYVNGQKINEKAFCPRKLEQSFDNEIPDEILDKLPKLSLAYFPAFRTVIDVSWAVINSDNDFLRPNRRHSVSRLRWQHTKSKQKTEFVRELFGQFVPELDYPATREIELALNEQIRTAIAHVSQADRTYFGNVPSKILEAFADKKNEIDDTETILSEIEKLSQEFQEYPIQVESMWNKLSASVKLVPNDSERVATVVLNVYREALQDIVKVQKESFAQIETYLSSVNEFLENKMLDISSGNDTRRKSPSVVIKPSGDVSISMSLSQALSSGERQIVTLLYATTIMSQKDIVLIDELEISLNVDWQRKLLPEMVAQMDSTQQLIVCTHSPIVGTEYLDRMIELKSTPTEELDTSFTDGEIDFSEPEQEQILIL